MHLINLKVSITQNEIGFPFGFQTTIYFKPFGFQNCGPHWWIVMSSKISLGPTLHECDRTWGHIIEASSPIETNINLQKSLKREVSSCENNPTNPMHLSIIEDSKHSKSELLNFFHLQCIRPFRDPSLSLLKANHRQICHRWIWWSCYPMTLSPQGFNTSVFSLLIFPMVNMTNWSISILLQ